MATSRKHSAVAELNEAAFRLKVALMRELGVLVHDGTTLGPEPPKRMRMDKPDEDPRAGKRAHYENLLGRSLSDKEVDALP